MLSRPGRGSLTIEGLRIEGALRLAEGKAVLALSRLSVESPRLLAEGSLRADAALPRVELTAKGTGLDVTGMREKLLSFRRRRPDDRGDLRGRSGAVR